MSKADELRIVKNTAEEEMMAARIELVAAASCFAKAKNKYGKAIDAWVTEMEKTQ